MNEDEFPPRTGLIQVVRRPEIEQAAAQVIASRRSARTRKAYTADFRRWIDFCAAHNFDPGNPLLPMTIAYRTELEKQYEPASVHRMLSSLSLIYRALMANAMVIRNPFDNTLLPRPELSREGKTPAAPEADAEILIAVAARDHSPIGLRDTAILRLLYDTGMRRASAAALLREDFDPKVRKARITVKGGRKEPVSLLPETVAALDAWLSVAPPSQFVFPGQLRRGARDVHINESTINRLITDRCEEADVDHIHPHCFRAAFATTAFDSKLPERAVQGSLHHSHIDTSRKYDRKERGGDVVDVVAALRQERREKR